MSKEQKGKIRGTVIETLPNLMFRVETETGSEMLVYLSGKLRLHKIKILLGDKVSIETNSYDVKRGRIIYRL
jgi:translation initiation factor IF-1